MYASAELEDQPQERQNTRQKRAKSPHFSITGVKLWTVCHPNCCPIVIRVISQALLLIPVNRLSCLHGKGVSGEAVQLQMCPSRSCVYMPGLMVLR